MYLCLSYFTDLLFQGQSGFRPQQSCENAATKLVDAWLSNIEHCLLTSVNAKVFDMINVGIPISKLMCYHFDKILFDCMDSLILTGRKLC